MLTSQPLCAPSSACEASCAAVPHFPCLRHAPFPSPSLKSGCAHKQSSKTHCLLPSLQLILRSGGSMASTSTFLFCFFLLSFLVSNARIEAHQVDESGLQLVAEALEWPASMSMYGGGDLDDGLIDLDGDDDEESGEMGRRSLFWRRIHYYYISYGALSANRIPCPPRSGRSYYTHNCFKNRAPVNPYSRGCSRITLCRR